MAEINFFAKTNFRNQERIFGIKRDDRRRHMYVIGKTGMGKSNMLENMAIQDIRNGEGVCVVDPHGEFAEKMLRAIPSNRINDVIYFNPSDSEFPIAFNILEAVDEDKKNLIASGMMGVFKKIWPDVWSARMEYILNNTILALLDYPGSTMLGVNRMMADKDYRKRVYPKIKDPVVKSFWLNEFDKWDDKFRKEAVAAIQNKVGQFLSSSVIRHIVGQPKSAIDMRDIMDNQKILIINLSKGRIGEDSMRLLGGMIVTKIQLAAMGRVEIPEEERKDFYLYVDEFQNFATESFANILSEARKYKLNLILAHQYINQLIFDSNTTVRDAVFGNVGTIISFRVGAEDAEHLEKEFDPVFLMNDIVNLSKYNIYLKLMIDGVAGDAFSAASLPPLDLSDTKESEEKVIRISRERYGKNRAEVEDRIARWSGMIMEDTDDVIIHKVEPVRNVVPNIVVVPKTKKIVGDSDLINTVPPVIKVVPKNPKPVSDAIVVEPVKRAAVVQNEVVDTAKDSIIITEKSNIEQKEKKELYETLCDTCEQKIYVPFKPDPNRPAFCKECLKDYQRALAKARNPQVANDQQQPVNNRPARNVAHSATGGQQLIVVKKPETVKSSAREEVRKVYVPQDKPMSLSQMSHIAPKKFKAVRQKPQVNLNDVRDLINKTKKDDSKQN
ncbi:MAG: type IV secretion system DNA-binding domain-containing protein [Parcubacteria group bacterium]|jgi:CxxC-x17-CxxC domain-containing protein